MSDRREDDEEPVGIEADAPEADWIEQHQPVMDESDDEPYASEVAVGDAEPVNIDADAPEADWIEQHQPVIDESDDERFPPVIPEEVADTNGDIVAETEPFPSPPMEFGGEPSREEPARTGARGCNLIGILAHALMRGAREAGRQLARRTLPR